MHDASAHEQALGVKGVFLDVRRDLLMLWETNESTNQVEREQTQLIVEIQSVCSGVKDLLSCEVAKVIVLAQKNSILVLKRFSRS
jgi:endo-alpha-1,4-polygalactosaminidase (GH114 family)